MFVLLIILLFAGLSPAQDSNIEKYQFISPLPGSKLIMPENNIIIRQGDIIDATTIKELSIEVIGSISGMHPGEFILSDDMRTLIFIPSFHFTPGEKVNVKVYSGIYKANGDMLSPIIFDFYISQTISKNERDKALSDVSDFPNSNLSTKYETNFLKINKDINDGLPEDFPEIMIDVNNNPSDGFWFIAPFMYPSPSSFLVILDNSGIPIYYERTDNRIYNFKLQPIGLLAFGDIVNRSYYVKDSSYALIDTFSTGNGYLTDNHDFLLLANGHSFLIAYDPQPVGMDTVVQGGDPTAIVVGFIVQELDVSKNVIFQWRSWDHYQITDATEDIDLTAHTIDYVHGNTIELDNDGNLMISARNMDEITKINRQTGDIIWRWGGNKSRNNQFQFVNDPRTFSHQHDIRRIESGNITLFDNGNLNNPQYSRAIEYELDEVEKKATLVWEFVHNPPIFKTAMGNVQRLSNGNTIIGWGGWLNTPTEAFNEISGDFSVEFEVSLPDTFTNYRAFKFPWRTNLFVTNPDSIFFESVPVGDSATISVDLINNSADPVDITGYYNINEDYVVENPVPFTLPAFGTVSLNIKFIPSKDGYFKDYLHIRSDAETSRIAQVMILAGSTDTITGNGNVITFLLEQNYPNPFNPGTTIRYSIPTQSNVTLRVYNSIGENIAKLVDVIQATGGYEINWDAGNFASGIYFYSIKAIPADGSKFFRSVRKMILLK